MTVVKVAVSGDESVQTIFDIEAQVPVETDNFISNAGFVVIVVGFPSPTKVYQTP